MVICEHISTVVEDPETETRKIRMKSLKFSKIDKIRGKGLKNKRKKSKKPLNGRRDPRN